MRYRVTAVLMFGALFFPLTLSGTSAGAGLLSREAEWGRQIYFAGAGRLGKPVTAYFGRDMIAMKGAGAACGNCHGHDGLGRPESGVVPTNITWLHLMKSSGHVHEGGLEHEAFTEESLKNYIKDGIYPGGRKGDPSMPVYAMDEEDLGALISFLRIMGRLSDTGISETGIRIGTLIPSAGPERETGFVIEKILRAYFSQINDTGGIFGRRLELVVERTAAGTAFAEEYLTAVLDKMQVFALVSTFTPGQDDAVPAVMEKNAVPLVGPLTLFPQDALSLNRNLFYIFSGLREQVHALIDFVKTNFPAEGSVAAVVCSARKDIARTGEDAVELLKARGWGKILKSGYDPGSFDAERTIEDLRREAVDVVVFLGPESEAGSFLLAINKSTWRPLLMMPGVLLGRSIARIPEELKDRVFLAYPFLPDDRKGPAGKALADMAGDQSISGGHFSAQVSAYASAQIMVEGLRRAGRSLSREGFLAVLEKMTQFDTGLMPSITYNKNRHIGASGAYIVTVDNAKAGTKDFMSSKGWVEVK